MEKVNEIILTIGEYKDKEEFQNEVLKTIFLLLKANYIMTVRREDLGADTVIIDFNFDDQTGSYGTEMPCWLTPEEEQMLEYLKNFASEEKIDIQHIGFKNCEEKED